MKTAAAPSDAGTYDYGVRVDAVSDESGSGNNCSATLSITVSTTPPAAERWKLYWTDRVNLILDPRESRTLRRTS